MANIAADALYEVAYRSTWGAADGPIGHLVIRRLDDHEIVAEVPATSEEEARDLIDRAETQVRGDASAFESEWGIAGELVADPGPDVVRLGNLNEPARDRSTGVRVTEIDERFTIFPEIRDVFAADQQWLAQALHPLISVRLSAVEPGMHGVAHFLSPVDDELLLQRPPAGEHSDYMVENWLIFQTDHQGHFRYLGDPDALQLGDLSSVEYEQAQAELAGAKTRWERYGRLLWGDANDPAKPREGWGDDIAFIDQLGGEPGYGNWAGYPPPQALSLDTGDPVSPVLTTADGKPLLFIGATAGYPWRDAGADAILLFVEPESGLVALTFDWS
ncbi:hypothetical protein GCM10027417_03780 [Glutamicibacter endophyticus]